MTKATAEPETGRDEAGQRNEAEADVPIDVEPVAEEVEAAERGTTEEDLGEMENKALAVRESVTVSPATMPSPREWEAMRAMAETICRTEFVPRDFRGRPEAVLAAILAGRELGIGPMQSLKDISIIDGRPAIAAHLALGLLRKGGVQIVESESNEDRARIKARRRDTGEVAEVEWTYEEASKVMQKGKPLVDKDNWRNYRTDMLWARCVGRLGRRLGSDILAGMPYTSEEVADFDDLETAGDGGYVSGPIEVRREEKVGQVPAPGSWQEMGDRLKQCYGEADAEAFGTFTRQACALLYGTQEVSELDKSKRDVLWQKSCTAYLTLRETVDRDFPPVTRVEMRTAWAKAVDGVELTGPEWRMGPDETDRPVREASAATEGEVKE